DDSHRLAAAGAKIDWNGCPADRRVGTAGPDGALLDVRQNLVAPAPILLRRGGGSAADHRSRPGDGIPVFAAVGQDAERVVMLVKCEAELFQVIGAFAPSRRLAGCLNGRQE